MGRQTAILATNSALPEKVLTYEELEERFGAAAMKKVLSGAGIRNRRVAAPEVCGSDLAYQAACELLDYHQIDRSTIDLLIHCTQTPDYFLPTTACVLHERLGLLPGCACFDINLGCSQYVYALSVAHSMISSGVASRALVLTGDTMARTLHPMDRSVVPLLGDGASASLVGVVPDGQGFLGWELGTDGTGHKYLIMPAGAFRRPLSPDTAVERTDEEGNVRTEQNLYMNGAAIFHFAISVVPPTVQRLLQKLSLSVADIDLFIFHQANKFMLEYLFKKLKIPAEKTHIFMEDIGNTSGSSVPIALTDAWRAGKIHPGARVLLIGFGVGLSWAATVIRWPDEALGVVPAQPRLAL
jgi:3-oxoacyl-[acyl-carrier-protein] synthase-3